MPIEGTGEAAGKPWFVYLVRALNGALYCGVSDDPHRRFATHLSGKGARFFRASPASALVYIEAAAGKGEALRRERAIKRLSKARKEALVQAMAVPAIQASEPAALTPAGVSTGLSTGSAPAG